VAGTNAGFAARTERQLLQTLLDRHSALAHSAESLRIEATEAFRNRDLSDMLDHEDPAADFDTETVLILAQRAELLLQEAEEALCRAASGTYGICVKCGCRIPVARLRLLPAAAMCVECSQLSSNPERFDGLERRSFASRFGANGRFSATEVAR
jgi:RNA polymerase-binding transcription factor DksA